MNRNRIKSFLLVCICGFASCAAPQPGGEEVGDSGLVLLLHNLVVPSQAGLSSGLRIFIPSGPAWPHDANFGGPLGADALCNNSVQTTNKPTGVYKALLVDAGTRRPCITPTDANCSGGRDPSWIMSPNTTYYRADGTTPVLTTNANGIFPFGTITAISAANFATWTGLNGDWTNHGNDCSAWTSSSGGAPSPSTRGKQGQSDQTDSGMLAVVPAVGASCATPAYVYCVGQ